LVKSRFSVKFEVADDFLKPYEVQKVGLDNHVELWIPSEDLEDMNDNIIGDIELINTFK